LSAVHGIVRTNRKSFFFFSSFFSPPHNMNRLRTDDSAKAAVTGWKSVYVNKGFTTRINGVTKDESDLLLKYLFDLVSQNHDAQVRFKWQENDLAIWDNRRYARFALSRRLCLMTSFAQHVALRDIRLCRSAGG
jgi:hypothetical protein